MAENDQNNEQQAAEQQMPAQPMFAIEKLYVKDLSLEVPGGAEVFLQPQAPEVSVQFKTAYGQLGPDVFEGVLQVTVTAKAENKVYFLVEVQQAGIFRVAGIPQEALQPFLGSAIPNVLFPYAREAVSDATVRAGFPPVVLQPVNFDAMAQQAPEGDAATEAPPTIQ
ncbi:MAG: protein-export chaperone SecB [Rhodocyclaceae bacterium]|jgi:preprotein translocase subunit SecB|nr:protein-export chaperone SecB [Rhodocyclaceae bacterium]